MTIALVGQNLNIKFYQNFNRLIVNYLFTKQFVLFFLWCSICICQTNRESVIAKDGDGIYSILRNNGYNPGKYKNEFIELNKEKINSNNEIYIGKSYLLPTKKETASDNSANKTSEHTIFGDENKIITIEDAKLKGGVFYLVAGHGGPDPGATTYYKNKLIAEDEYAYDVTLRLARYLLEHDATVYMIIKDPNDGIRDSEILEVDYDETHHDGTKIARSQKIRLRQRTALINKLYKKHKGQYQRVIVVHVDSRSKGKNIDVFFYHHKGSKTGKKLTENIHTTFKKKYAEYQPNRIYDGNISTRALYLVKYTYPPTAFIELGNISNAKDHKRILKYDNREALAKWIYLGLREDFENNNK